MKQITSTSYWYGVCKSPFRHIEIELDSGHPDKEKCLEYMRNNDKENPFQAHYSPWLGIVRGQVIADLDEIEDYQP